MKEEAKVVKTEGEDINGFHILETAQEVDGIPMGKVIINDLFKVEPTKPINEAFFQIFTSSNPK